MDAFYDHAGRPHFPPAPDAPGTGEGYSIPDSGDVAGIELRLLPPFIRDNHTLRFWPFPARAHLYCLTVVVSDAANQLSGGIDLSGFPRIGRGEHLPLHKTIYYWEAGSTTGRPPNQLHAMCSVIKSKESLRETGEVLQTVRDDGEYQDLIGRLGSLVSDAGSFNAVAGLTLQLSRIVGRYLGRVDNRPIGTVVRSFTRLRGDWDGLGVTPVPAPTPCVDFEFELIVRDRQRRAAPEDEEEPPVSGGIQPAAWRGGEGVGLSPL